MHLKLSSVKMAGILSMWRWVKRSGYCGSCASWYPSNGCPDCKVYGANMGPIWGRQDPGGPHVGPIKFAIWVGYFNSIYFLHVCCIFTVAVAARGLENTMLFQKVFCIPQKHKQCGPCDNIRFRFLLLCYHGYQFWLSANVNVTIHLRSFSGIIKNLSISMFFNIAGTPHQANEAKSILLVKSRRNTSVNIIKWKHDFTMITKIRTESLRRSI